MSSNDSSSQQYRSTLSRGEACLICRRRKMKCDAGRPCGSCVRSGKGEECEYEDTRYLVQIHGLQSHVVALQQRIRELESQARAGVLPTTQAFSAFMQPTSTSTPAVAPAGLASSNVQAPPIQLQVAEVVHLLQSFVPHATQFGLPLASITHLQTASQTGPTPLSLAAIAVSSHFYPSHPTATTTQLFQRAQNALLSAPTPSLLEIQAHALLSSLAFIMGKELDGHRHCAAAVQVAVNQGLHALGQYRREPGERDKVETWWMVYRVDAAWSAITGVSSSAPAFSGITTAFVPSKDGQMAGLLPGLYTGPAYSFTDGETRNSMRVKAFALFLHAHELIAGYAPNRHIPQSYWRDVYSTTAALNKCLEVLPEESVSVKIVVSTALLGLHSMVNERDGSVAAVEIVAQVVKSIEESDWVLLDPAIGFCLKKVEGWMKRDAAMYPDAEDDEAQENLSAISLAVARLATIFPYVESSWSTTTRLEFSPL
ncbi:hypothetical protein EXIGLDRAFT_839956 [Exidia glandulosa HHB12029]|uniref:Zn(2)-C6 fungal-type domain-containing protein n=1 Tax=Exidia glandulosa HHB12029 TaxID=1314781 RepID=A0A165EQK8_EXIGL|nr:hypothetical protein EXIGLDRAFT_839956 [Exidia glandulosa HHB12029]